MSGAVYRFRARLAHRIGLHLWRYFIGSPRTAVWWSTWRKCSWCGKHEVRPEEKR